MTVQSTLARVSYTIAGAGPYTVPYYFLADGDIIAIRTPADGSTPVTLTLTTDYTLTGAGDEDGGALTLVITGVDGDALTIINEPPITQLTQYPTTGRFPADSHERALDKLTMIVKRVYDLAGRALRLNDGDAATSLELPAASDGKLLGWSGAVLVNTSPAGVGPGTITPTELDRAYQPLDAQLTTLAGITAQQATDLASLSTFMGTVLNDANPATVRATIGTNDAANITTGDIAAARIATALNATGSAPFYTCRAWVNFNGTGTVAISGSGNVSSITDNGTGNYTVNFTTAMPDANYCYTSNIDIAIATLTNANTGVNEVSKLAGSFQFRTNDSAGTATDCESVNLTFFR